MNFDALNDVLNFSVFGNNENMMLYYKLFIHLF